MSIVFKVTITKEKKHMLHLFQKEFKFLLGGGLFSWKKATLAFELKLVGSKSQKLPGQLEVFA